MVEVWVELGEGEECRDDDDDDGGDDGDDGVGGDVGVGGDGGDVGGDGDDGDGNVEIGEAQMEISPAVLFSFLRVRE